MGQTVRLRKIRHTGFLLEMGGQRVAIDPWVSRLPGVGVWSQAKPALVDANAMGDVDVLCLSGGGAPQVDAAVLQSLRHRERVACLVPDDDVAKRLRQWGYRKVRVVQPGDVVGVRSLDVTISPGGTRFADRQIGFHFKARQKTPSASGLQVWHMGAPTSFDDDNAVARFARQVTADLVLAHLSPFGRGGWTQTLPPDDALLLAHAAHARWVVPQGDALSPTWPTSWVLPSPPPPTALPPGVSPLRLVNLDDSGWVQFSLPAKRAAR